MVPAGTALAYQVPEEVEAPFPSWRTARGPPETLVNTEGSVTEVPHVNVPSAPWTAHLPLLEVRVKLGFDPAGGLPAAVAVNVAHVPVVYQVPELMMQPVG